MPSAAQPDFVAYLCKRFMLEKNYCIWRPDPEETAPHSITVDDRFSIPTAHIPELAPLQPLFDNILVKADGMNFMVVGIRLRQRNRPSAATVEATHEQVRSVSMKCRKYTGSVSNQKMPCVFLILEIFDDVPTSKDEERLKNLMIRQTTGENRFTITTCALIPDSFALVTSLSLIPRYFQTTFLKRWIDEQMQSDAELLAQVASAGFKIIPAILGVVICIGMAYLFRYGLVSLGATDGKLYGGADLFGGILGTMFSVFIRKIHRKSGLQALVTSTIYIVLWYGFFIWSGVQPDIEMGLCALTVIGICFMFGALGEGA